jgi:sec-independent protein translocase protein TatA
MHVLPLAFGIPGIEEWVVIAFFGLLFFGKRLPEVGRSLGKGIVEFKKGLAGIEEEVTNSTTTTPPAALPKMQPAQPALPTAGVETEQPRFDPYTGKPLRFDPYTGKPLADQAVASSAPTDNVGTGNG